MNCTIVGFAKAMLHAAGLTQGFWKEVAAMATHVRNRAPSRVIDWMSSIEKLTGKAPDISYFRVFGCKAYV